MINVKNVDLLVLQTKQMQQDITTRSFTTALNPEFNQLALQVEKCLILSKVDELSEEILDELAWELHVEWYDANASIDIKRNLIKNSDKVHMYLGTPYAVEQVINDYFGNGQVEEWFEYNGSPYRFRVITTNPSVTAELANQFTNAVNSVKNKRSRLEQIVIALSGECSINYAGAVHTGDNLTIRQVV